MARPKLPVDSGNAIDIRQSGLIIKDFLKLLSERQEIYRPSSVEDRYKAINRELATMLATAGHKSVFTPDWKVTFTPGASSRIDAKKLLVLGVSAQIIKKATVTVTYETVTVTANK